MVDSEFHLKDTLCVELDHKYHHMLKKIKHQIEETQDCKIFFPVCGEGLDSVQIHAKKEKKLLVLSQLQAVLPESFVFPLRTETAVKVFECPEFDILVNLFIEKYSLTLSSHVISDVRIDLITSGSYDAMSRYKAMAIEALATFLRTKGLSILSQKERSRVSFHAFGKDEPLSDDSSIDVLFFQSHSDIVPSFKSRLSTQLAGSAPNLRTSASLTHEYANENPLFATPVKWQRSVNQPPIGSAAISKLRSTSASKISRSLENQHVIIVNQDSSIRSAVDQITSYTNGRQSLPLHIRRNTLEGASIPPKISTKPLFSGGEAFNGITSAPLRERLMSPLMPESFTDQTAPETFEDEISVRNTVIQNITALDSRENNRKF
jgi:hypothetical protein